MLKNKNNLLNIGVLTWKDDNSLYFPSGVYRMINCNHVKEGNFGVNITGEVFPIPTATVPAGYQTSPPSEFTDFEQQSAQVPAGNVFGASTAFPTGDPKFKKCIRIKDLTTLITYYVDAADYATKIVGCNPVAYTVT